MIASKSRRPLHILLVVDGSEHTQAAIQLLCHLPLPAGSQVIAAGVLASRYQAGQEAMVAAVKETQLLLWDKVRTTTEWLYGHPAKVLIEFAGIRQSDLIVIGAKGLRAIFGFLLDGVVQQMVEAADRPVLVVRPPCRGVRRVLLAVEDSSPSWAAVRYLARFPFPTRTEIRVMHVLPPRFATASYPYTYSTGLEGLPPSPITTEAAEAMAQEIAYKENKGQATLKQAVESLRLAGKKTAGVLARGDAATELMAYTKAQAIDLIVVGSRGLGKLGGWLMGSVSRKLIHSAGCSVLVVKS